MAQKHLLLCWLYRFSLWNPRAILFAWVFKTLWHGRLHGERVCVWEIRRRKREGNEGSQIEAGQRGMGFVGGTNHVSSLEFLMKEKGKIQFFPTGHLQKVPLTRIFVLGM